MTVPRPSIDQTTFASTRPPAPHPSVSTHVAHHIDEFGELEDNAVVHFTMPGEASEVSALPVYGMRKSLDKTHPEKPKRRTHATGALGRLFRKPSLQQFFYNDVLFRHKAARSVSREELFLDLVLVAGIATLGHHLRVAPLTWALVENFLLLFFVIYAAWRQLVLLWNYWGVNEDMLDKVGIYVTFVCISSIALGSYDPFSPIVRGFVGISSFLSSFVPLLESFVWASADPLLKIPTNRTNTLTVGCILSALSLSPLLAASFVGSERLAKNLFWVSIVLQMVSSILPTYIVRYLHRADSRYSRPAINIEHAAEKFEVLTMIFMGEAVIALLSEGPPLVAMKGASIVKLYLAGFLCTAMLYSFQTLYVQVDNRILRRGKHALRHDAGHGIAWEALHMPYHLSLVLVATGLGLALRDVAFTPKYGAASAAEHIAVRAAADLTAGTTQFTLAARWLFSVGWASTMISSSLLSFAHVGGPRAATKLMRVCVRCFIALALMIGMPFTSLSALNYIGVFATVAAICALAEFVLVQFDRIGLLRSEILPSAADVWSGESVPEVASVEGEDSESVSECEIADENDDDQVQRLERVLSNMTTGDVEGLESFSEEEVPEVIARALQRRITLGASRLVHEPKSKGWYQKRYALG